MRARIRHRIARLEAPFGTLQKPGRFHRRFSTRAATPADSERESAAVPTITGRNEVPAVIPPALVWNAAELADRERLLSLEWLETDGLGGYASGTVGGSRTRREHGWYVPAIPP